MTVDERRALEHEQTRRYAYGHGVLAHGPDGHLSHVKGGWTVTAWDGSRVPTVFRLKREARGHVTAHGFECLKKAREIGGQLETAAFDELMASTTPEERAATARAMHDAYAPRRRFRRTA